VRNWREKLLALLLAFLFWFMIKARVQGSGRGSQPPLPPLRAS